MKVVVFYNDDAGGGAERDEVQKAIERHGHDVLHVVDKEEGVERLFDHPADLIVAAGGDGTVATVAREVAGRQVPLAILPLGTANNIALSLGCDAPMETLIDHWREGQVQLADLGAVHGPWGERKIVEGVGGGLVARAIATIDAQPLDSDHPADHRIELAIGGYLNVLTQLQARPWTLRLDDRPVTGDFLLVEILNICSIGPNFVVSERATPFDGCFTVVLATEADRDHLLAYWKARMAGESPALDLPVRNATEVMLESGDDLHIDDALFAWPASGGVRIDIERGVLPILRGPRLC